MQSLHFYPRLLFLVGLLYFGTRLSASSTNNRRLSRLCPYLTNSLCHRSNYTAAHTMYPEEVVRAVSAKFFLNTFGCGPSYAIEPRDHKLLLKRSCGNGWLRNRREIDSLLCDHAALWAGGEMIQRCTSNDTMFWGNDECFDLVRDVWNQEQREILCSTLEVERSSEEYRRARDEMKCFGYYPSTRRSEICASLEGENA